MKTISLVLLSALCLDGALLLTGCSTGAATPVTPSTPTPTPTTPTTALTVTSVGPATIAAGAAATTLTVNGTGFTSATTIQVGTATEATTFVSSTQVTAVVPPAQMVNGALLPVSAVNGAMSSPSTPVINFEVDNPQPVITLSAPAVVTLGSPATTVTVTGTGFVPATTIQANGAARPSTYVSATQMTVLLTAADLAGVGKVALMAINAAPGGGSSAAAAVAVNNPVPAITTLAPASVAAGSPTTTETVSGTGFLPGTVIQINGTGRPTTYISATQLSVALTVADIATPGTVSVVGVNPTPGGGSSPAATVAVTNPAPVITLFAPATLVAGSPATTETVSGTGFLSSTVLQVNGAARSTTFVSPTQLSVSLTAADLASAGTVSLVAVNAAPGGGASGAASVPVTNPAPGTIVLNPVSVMAGSSTATTVTVTGTNFVAASLVQVNGTTQATTYVSSTKLTFTLSTTQQASGAFLSITVLAPPPGGGTSTAATFTINNPVPGTITLSPSSASVSSTSLLVTVTGTNLNSSSTVLVNGSVRSTYDVSAQAATFYLNGNDLAATGQLNVLVANATPGGGLSPTTTFAVTPVTTAPAITSVSPFTLYASSATTTLSVYGNYLAANSVVLCNGTALATTYVGTNYNYYPYSGYLTAILPASFLTGTGNLSITVSTPTATPSLSNSYSLLVSPEPVPTLTSISPASGPMNTATTLTLYGSNFTAGSTVAYNGANLATTYNTSGYLTATLSPAAVALPGTGSITVTNPGPGGGTTAALSYTAYIGIANNSMVYNPVNGLFYVSVPSTAGAPYGNAVVSVDPLTGSLGTPIFVGSEPNKLAITSDGKYLWVGLDGASAVRKVDLTAGKAGLQFSLGQASFSYSTPTAVALAALPGNSDSVVVSTQNSSTSGLAIFDAGVARTKTLSSSLPLALLVDGTKGEIYAGTSSAYQTYTYNAQGLTLKTSFSNVSTASSSYDEMQIAGGILYTDFGQALDPEAGALLGTFYLSGSTAAGGSTAADTTLGRVFILDNPTNNYYAYSQIQVFNTADYNLTSSSAIPINVSTYIPAIGYTTPTRLTRWGTNGLAFRTTLGVYSLRSNLVKDLSTTSADLAVTLASTGVATGANTTYTATIANNGPSAATNIAVTAMLPSTGTLVSVTPSVGACSTAVSVACNLGGLANGASATVTFVVAENTAGTATMTVQVTGSENDPTPANNQASSTSTIAGATSSPVPVLNAVTPATIASGSLDTTLTVTGSGFTSGSQIKVGSALLTTTFTSSSLLSATVPAATLATLGWQPVSVTTSGPGGGTSASLPLSIYSVIKLGVNHIVYDPYSRQIMASVGNSGTSSVTGNSIVPITPDTATLGTAVPIGSQPTSLALTSDGQILYTVLTGSNSVGRFNMLTQKADFSFSVPPPSSSFYTLSLGSVATQPGTENTIALGLGSYLGVQLYDFDPVGKTAAARGAGSNSYSYYNGCLQFLDAGDLFGSDNSYSFYRYPVTSTGLGTISTAYLRSFSCFKLDGGLAFSSLGGVAAALSSAASPLSPATPLGSFPLSSSTNNSSTNFAPDASLGRAFFLTTATAPAYSYSVDGVASYDASTFLASSSVSLNMAATEGTTSFNGIDVIRWGQDGLAVLTSGGHIYLLRGPVVAPQLLNANASATLTTSSAATLAHGTGNTLLTLTGSGFVPGVAVTWNGGYRTTTILDATHLTLAIPASDLATAGTATLVATNPGASASSSLTLTVN